jgi:hypothetical protein
MKRPLLIAAFLLVVSLSYGQSDLQVVAPAGGNGQSSDTQVSWTLGETVTTTVTGENNTLTQGFQQPNLLVTAIKTEFDCAFAVNAFPNPTGNILMVHVENIEIRDLQYVLLDLNGKILEKKLLEGNITAVSIENYPAGIYLLKIKQSGDEIKMFEIIKK